MTLEEFLAIPDDGKRRWLINGRLREEDRRFREPLNSVILANVASALKIWTQSFRFSPGTVVCGEAGVAFPTRLDTFIGLDAAYLSNEVMSSQTDDFEFIRGVPTLVVEILSRSTRTDHRFEKIVTYLDSGVELIWLINPDDKTVTIYRSDEQPSVVNIHQELTGLDALPGFMVSMTRLFE